MTTFKRYLKRCILAINENDNFYDVVLPFILLSILIGGTFAFVNYKIEQNSKEIRNNYKQYWQSVEQIDWENTPKGFGAWELVKFSKDGQIIAVQGKLIDYLGNSYYKFEDLDEDTFIVKLDSSSDFDWSEIKRNQLIDLTAKISTEKVIARSYRETKKILVGISAVIAKKEDLATNSTNSK